MDLIEGDEAHHQHNGQRPIERRPSSSPSDGFPSSARKRVPQPRPQNGCVSRRKHQFRDPDVRDGKESLRPHLKS